MLADTSRGKRVPTAPLRARTMPRPLFRPDTYSIRGHSADVRSGNDVRRTFAAVPREVMGLIAQIHLRLGRQQADLGLLPGLLALHSFSVAARQGRIWWWSVAPHIGTARQATQQEPDPGSELAHRTNQYRSRQTSGTTKRAVSTLPEPASRTPRQPTRGWRVLSRRRDSGASGRVQYASSAAGDLEDSQEQEQGTHGDQ